MQYLLLALGGASGSIARFKLGQIITSKAKGKFPYGTFIINVSGALLLGIVSNADLNKNLVILFADGFLGAYTTFSTFMFESFTLFNNKKINALIYIILTLILGLFSYFIGSMIIKMFI